MTDETTVTPNDGEPGGSGSPEAQQPDIDEQPTSVIPPANAEATGTPTPVDEFSTVIDPQSTQADTTQAAPDLVASPFSAAPDSPELPQARAYEQFGILQPPLSPDAAPALPAQDEYMPYTGQPGLPGQFYPGQPVAPIKRHRPVVWIVLAIVVVLLVGGGTAFAIVANMGPKNTPTQVLQQFCDGLKTLNAQEIYDSFSAASKANTSVSQIQQSLDLLKNLNSSVSMKLDCKVGNVQQNGSTATGVVTMIVSASVEGFSMSPSFTMSMQLMLENNLWKIDASSTSMPDFDFPTMPAMPTFPPGFLTPTTTSN